MIRLKDHADARRPADFIDAVAGRILFIGFTVQIILGMVWMVGNFARCQQFGEVNSLLYPVILMLAKGMGRSFPVPYYCFVYIFQAAMAFGAAYFFVGVVQDVFLRGRSGSHGELFRVWAALAVITAIPVMQCVLALLPYGLAGAILLTELGLAVRLIGGDGGMSAVGKMTVDSRQIDRSVWELLKISALWVLGALFLHEYALFGALPVLAAFAAGLRGNRAKAGKVRNSFTYCVTAAIVIAASFGLLSAVYGLCGRIGIYEEKNPGFVKGLFSRTCLTTVLWDWDTWTEELEEQLAWEVRYSASYYADNITLEVEPYIDEKYGDEADHFYLDTAKDAWDAYSTQIIHETLWDAAGYSVSPLIIKRQLSGLGYMSLTARNYEMMKRGTPILTKHYVNFYLDWFAAALAILTVCAVAEAVNILRNIKKSWILCVLILLVTAACMCIRYVLMGAGIMDYKRTWVITALWTILMLFPVRTALFGAGRARK